MNARGPLLVLAFAAWIVSGARCASAPPSPEAQKVRVVHRREGYGAGNLPLPAGCRLLASHPSVDLTERELALFEFARERERSAASGGNVVLAREEITVPRRDDDCPAASPITDCPPSEGAWFRVTYDDYACSAEAADELSR